MARITSKLQVTVPKVLAQHYALKPGDEIEWEAAGDVIRVVPPRRKPVGNTLSRLKFFDQATVRQQAREQTRSPARATSRGWSREELYQRGRTR